MPLVTAMPTVAVSIVYCVWFAYRQISAERERRKRERVTFLLWSAATGRVEHAPFDA